MLRFSKVQCICCSYLLEINSLGTDLSCFSKSYIKCILPTSWYILPTSWYIVLEKKVTNYPVSRDAELNN